MNDTPFKGLLLILLCGLLPAPAAAGVSRAMLEQPPPEDWLMWRRTADAWAYSPLDQINRGNVDKLTLAWALAMEAGAQEATPLVHHGVMYLPHPGNLVQALDARSGDRLWEYRHELDDRVFEQSVLDMSRHLAIFGDKIYLATLDAHIVALDAASGAVVWDHQVADYTLGYRYTSGPMVFDGKIVAGMSGCTSTAPGGCFVSAHDPETGTELWRVHAISQDPDPQSAGWGTRPPAQRWGGSTWLSGSYDPVTRLVFWGTGVPIPYGERQRGGVPQLALYTNSTLAIDVDTGALRWHRQHLPRDNWDMDHPFERFIVDRREGAATRRTVVGVFGKPGIVWALDAATGRYLWSRETIHQNVIESIHPETGEVTVNADLIPAIGQQVQVCPSNIGGKNWNAGTYYPATDAIYVAQNQTCMDFTLRPVDESQFPRGEDLHLPTNIARYYPAPGKADAVGRIDAISVRDGTILWTHEQPAPWTGALLSTGGGLIIGGDAARRLKAFDAETGGVLWEIPLSAVISGFPVSYAVHGRQYLAVPVGGGTQLDGVVAPMTRPVRAPAGSNVLMVFALPR